MFDFKLNGWEFSLRAPEIKIFPTYHYIGNFGWVRGWTSSGGNWGKLFEFYGWHPFEAGILMYLNDDPRISFYDLGTIIQDMPKSYTGVELTQQKRKDILAWMERVGNRFSLNTSRAFKEMRKLIEEEGDASAAVK